MAKAMGLMFSLFNVASARHVPFGIPLYVQCILHGLTSVLLCVPFIFAGSERLLTAKGIDLAVAHSLHNRNCP